MAAGAPPAAVVPAAAKDARPSSSLADLRRVLDELGVFETEAQERHRAAVMEKLNRIVLAWATQLTARKNYTVEAAAAVRLYPFGSCKLGVHTAASDLDMLCVGARHVTQGDFFVDLVEFLRTEAEVSALNCVADAHVPVIKLRIGGTPVDLLYARLPLQSLPASPDLMDDGMLRAMDEKSVLALNGWRCAEYIIRQVNNSEAFRTALRAIKLWAKRRHLYSNMLGLLGGISWSLLVARIFLFTPEADAAGLLTRFFQVYSTWKWPNPVLLSSVVDLGYGHKVWNPWTNPKDRTHLMPIITPVYPAMNTSYNVSESALSVITQELTRGANIVTLIEQDKAAWATLFDKSNFFNRFRVYLQLDVRSASQDESRRWFGWVQSRLRILIQLLETVPHLKCACPYPICIPLSGSEAPAAMPIARVEEVDPDNDEMPTSLACAFFVGLEIESGQRMVDLTAPANRFIAQLKEWPEYRDTMDITILPIKKDRQRTRPKGKRALPAGSGGVVAASAGGDESLGHTRTNNGGGHAPARATKYVKTG